MGQGPSCLKATDLADFPAANEALAALACQPVAALATAPAPSSEDPPSVAISPMTTRKLRIFFIDTPFLPAFPGKQSPFHLSLAIAGIVLAIEWAHRDLLTK